MGSQHGQGKGVFIRKLIDYHGYKTAPAIKIVNQVVGIIVKALKSGKNVEIPGLGVLEVGEYPWKTRRQIVEAMKSGRSCFTLYKQRKTIRLKANPPYMKED